jgi:hypothetical protein
MQPANAAMVVSSFVGSQDLDLLRQTVPRLFGDQAARGSRATSARG